MLIAYARVSTQEQDLSGQLESLRIAGAEKIYQEKISGAKSNRPELVRMMDDLRAGDVLLVTRLDRLARSTLDLLSILKRLGDIGASFRSLADTWADTTTAHGRLILTVLAGLAEFERELIKARTGEGRKRAMLHGTKSGRPFGRPWKLTAEQKTEAIARVLAGESRGSVAAAYGVHRKSIARLIPRSVSEVRAAPCSAVAPVPAPS